MADDREPPPFEDSDSVKDDEDLFSDASEVKVSDPASLPVDQEPTEQASLLVSAAEESVSEPATANTDFFSGSSTEVKLNCDEESETPPGAQPAGETTPTNCEPAKGMEEPPKVGVTQTSTTTSKSSATMKKMMKEMEEEDPYTIEIKVSDPHRMGDGMGAYIVYRVTTKTTIPAFCKPQVTVIRRFSDFLGIHGKLAEKYVHCGRIVPPAPEKSVLGMTKVKMSKEESGSAEFIERRRAALERYLNRTASHPVLRVDPDFREFLEMDGELPRATNTSALSGAGVLRFFQKVGDVVEKITFKMDERDEWFEEKQQQIEALDQQLRKLHTSVEALVQQRRDLSASTATFAKSAAMLGNAEEHTALSRALSQLAETEEKIEQLHKDQGDQDYYLISELLKDYISLIQGVKDVFHERVKSYKFWKDAEVMLTKKRDNKARLELSNKSDKLAQAQQEITDWEQKVEKGQEQFEKISEMIKLEVNRFERCRVEDFKTNVISYLEHLMETQQKLIKYWEVFLPEAKAIA